eukprot:scaffold98385_cov30-Tisochrysis_lutea.AAC.2
MLGEVSTGQLSNLAVASKRMPRPARASLGSGMARVGGVLKGSVVWEVSNGATQRLRASIGRIVRPMRRGAPRARDSSHAGVTHLVPVEAQLDKLPDTCQCGRQCGRALISDIVVGKLENLQTPHASKPQGDRACTLLAKCIEAEVQVAQLGQAHEAGERGQSVDDSRLEDRGQRLDLVVRPTEIKVAELGGRGEALLEAFTVQPGHERGVALDGESLRLEERLEPPGLHGRRATAGANLREVVPPDVFVEQAPASAHVDGVAPSIPDELRVGIVSGEVGREQQREDGWVRVEGGQAGKRPVKELGLLREDGVDGRLRLSLGRRDELPLRLAILASTALVDRAKVDEDAEARKARLAQVAMFQHHAQHPAQGGEVVTARVGVVLCEPAVRDGDDGEHAR